ncbi:kelch repeat-containing protein [Nonomuraea sp. SYSU D8015]|uniref:kelch repeat-containing protein n=1 Tax=Nonomuraea sp. SYSU D8015 TaxID=2593644 RepID=UPI0016605835|nr:kelch repeat-containing protein [Nonomuraea sp. SYSU D8015]
MSRLGWAVTLGVVLAVAAGFLVTRFFAGPDSFQPRQVSPLPDTGLAPRSHHTAVWTGTQMIIWGGTAEPTETRITPLFDGAAYNPSTGKWRRISPSPKRPPRLDARAAAVPGHVAIASGSAILLYDVSTDRWRTFATKGPVYDVTAADERIVATGLERDGHVELTILDPREDGEGVAEDLGGFRTRGRLTSLGAVFDGTDEIRILAVEVDRNNTDHRCGASITVWTGVSLLVWGGTSCCDRPSGGRSRRDRFVVAVHRCALRR